MTLQALMSLAMNTFLTALFALLIAFPAAAHEFEVGKLKIIHPVAQATSPNAEPTETIGYFRVRNDSDKADRLMSVSAPEISDVIQIMFAQPDEPGISSNAMTELDIPANQETVLTPNANHIMFAKLKGPLPLESSFPAVLRFEHAGEVTVIFNVEGASDPHSH